jgi:integrase
VYVDACSEVYRPLAEVLIATVMRISEALALRWDDVDFANRVIRVYRQRTAAGEDGHTKSRRFAPFLWARLLSGLRDLRGAAGGDPGDGLHACARLRNAGASAQDRPWAMEQPRRVGADGSEHGVTGLAQGRA